MALTETQPEATAPAAEAEASPPAVDPVSSVLASGDHKTVGRLYLSFALVLLLVASIVSTVVGFERVDQGGFDVFGRETYFQISTLSATGMVFMVLLPLLIGLAMVVVPLQVGARSIAFPRAAAASFWGYLVSSAMVIATYGINGGPGGGNDEAVDLWILSFAFLIASLLLGALCIVATVVANRPPGMTLDRVPFFSWSMLVTGTLWMLTLPVMLAVLLLVYVDHLYGRTLFDNFQIYPAVHWLLRTPQIYTLAIPALGIVADIVPVMGRARQRQHGLMMVAIAFFGLMGFGAFMVGAWRAAMVVSPVEARVELDPLYDQWMWVGMGIAIGLPVLILLGGWVDTLRRGRPRLHSSFLYAVAGILILLAGVAAGALLVIKPLELAGTTWEVGQADLVIWSTVVAVVAGLHYWAPKLSGRQLGDAFGKVVLLLFLVGTGLLAGGNLAAGVPGETDHLIVASSEGFDGIVVVSDTVEVANGAAALGSAVLVVASFLVVVNILASSFVRLDEPVAGDPWDGHTLEWATASPPAHGNFDEVALVTSADPLLDAREGDGDTGAGDASTEGEGDS